MNAMHPVQIILAVLKTPEPRKRRNFRMPDAETNIRQPGLGLALVPIILTLIVLGIQLFWFGDFTPHIPLAFGIAITGLVGLKLGHKWPNIEAGVFHVINISLPSVSILITVGMIIGVWIASGTVPTLIYYGLKILSPEWFLAAGMLLCSIVSVSLGTSWGPRAPLVWR